MHSLHEDCAVQPQMVIHLMHSLHEDCAVQPQMVIHLMHSVHEDCAVQPQMVIHLMHSLHTNVVVHIVTSCLLSAGLCVDFLDTFQTVRLPVDTELVSRYSWTR